MVIPAIVYLILIVFGILNLILFFKLWGMCNDMRKLKDFLTSRFSLEAERAINTKDETIEPNGKVTKTGTIVGYHYKIHGNDAVEVFDNGTGKLEFSGQLKTYPNSTCGVWLGQSLYVYKDEKCAVNALITYNEDNKIDKDGLIEKR